MSLDEANRIGKAAENARRRSRASMKILLPTAAALGAGAAIAVGQIPGSAGTITACYQTVTQGQNGADFPYGGVRLIDPSANTSTTVAPEVYRCSTNEQTITWNQQGPPGVAGPQGPAGPQGGEGPPGAIVGSTNFSIAASKTDRLLMKLEGITGEVTQKGFKGDIELTSFAAGAENAIGATTGGAGAGKVNVQSFSFAKKTDGTDGVLFKALATHRSIKLADIGVYHVGSKGQLVQVADYKLNGVVVTSIHKSGKAETVSGTFQKLTQTVGTGPNKVATGWNLTTQKAP